MLSDGQLSLSDAVIKQSREYLITEAEKVLLTTIDRYVILTETSYKSIFNVFGNVDVFLEEEIAYDTEDMFLELKGKNEGDIVDLPVGTSYKILEVVNMEE